MFCLMQMWCAAPGDYRGLAVILMNDLTVTCGEERFSVAKKM